MLSDAALCRAVMEMEAGLVDADLGGGLFKKCGTRCAAVVRIGISENERGTVEACRGVRGFTGDLPWRRPLSEGARKVRFLRRCTMLL
ncbi:type II toxin-antitoxin system RelE/ParE family toxin [Stenotrophomonas sp.]|uniref:type II toxin-antitoxin system RelE/ParE family toxin n=1 Tax=Stenotrophomonas sp. TaxID=69392 RepID=UPI0028AFB410|nr:type II toxin-antitoxin system RelE/ParE family toxin [Stenotrophomonas sp.]